MVMSLQCREIESVLLSEAVIRRRVEELARQITRDYRGRIPIFVAVLRGAAVFLADLIRHVDLNLKVDFLAVSSYGAATVTSAKVRLTKDLDSDIQNEDVILVEDIVDTGLTLTHLVRHLRSRGPASLRVCSLLSKPARRRVVVSLDYLGFEIPDEFVVGYGLDFDQRYRNLRYIAVLNEEPASLRDGEKRSRSTAAVE